MTKEDFDFLKALKKATRTLPKASAMMSRDTYMRKCCEGNNA